MTTQNNHIPFKATHPGSLIKEELEARNINQKDFATLIDMQKTMLNEIIKGKRPVTADLAILLENTLEIPADYWLNFQSQYDLNIARIKEKSIQKLYNINIWKIIKEYVPVSYFKKIGYFIDDISSDIAKVKEVYNINNVDELVSLTATQKFSFFRKSVKLTVNENNVLAWNVVAKYEANKQQVPSFDGTKIPLLIEELKTIFYNNSDAVNEVHKKLNQYGIKFILVQKLDQTPIDGYTFWSGENPVIALTLRHSRIDNLAFTIMHEIGHIDLHLKDDKNQQFFDLQKNDSVVSPLEKQADEYAQANLIPHDIWSVIISSASRSDESIITFSHTYKIHPAIILGRINFASSNFAIKTTIDKKLH